MERPVEVRLECYRLWGHWCFVECSGPSRDWEKSSSRMEVCRIVAGSHFQLGAVIVSDELVEMPVRYARRVGK